jgi:lipoprotein NlpI
LCVGLALSASVPALEPDSELIRVLQAERRQRMELSIARASEQIESPGVEGKALAAAFRARAAARGQLLQHAEALDDFSRAIELDPFNPQYYEERARIYLRLREFNAASADLDMALGLDSRRWSAHRDKGRLAAYQRDFHLATTTFARALRMADDESAPYNALWLDIAARRAGGNPSRVLDEILGELPPGHWPEPVLKMLRGMRTPQEVIDSVALVNPRAALLQRCEAHFYAGELHLVRGEPEAARAAFEAAVATGVIEFLEYDWALRELELLDQPPP